jgi:alkylated DNA repair protein (DNA oxidative demethylase)
MMSDNGFFLEGFRHLPGYLTVDRQTALMAAVGHIVAAAPLFRPTMPRTGQPFSVRMTNCGPLGWVSDRAGGYRYQAQHPETGRRWPAIPDDLIALWREVADCAALPEACLVNHYGAGAKLGSHVDADEAEMSAPVVSVSLGDAAVFHVGGPGRRDPKQRLVLASGDVVVLGGAARRARHGIDRIRPGTSDIVPWGGRINLTLRRVNSIGAG